MKLISKITLAGFLFCFFYLSAYAQQSPKQIFDLMPDIPKNYNESIDPGNCSKFNSLKNKLEETNPIITRTLQELQPKVQTAMMQNPMVMADEAIINLMQYASHEYFTIITEENMKVNNIISEMKSAFNEELQQTKQSIEAKYDCGKHMAGSPQEEACDNARKNELFEKSVKLYNEYLKEIEPDLLNYKAILKKCIMYLHDNITAVKEKNNDVARYYISNANFYANLLITGFPLNDIHCEHPNFIPMP